LWYSLASFIPLEYEVTIRLVRSNIPIVVGCFVTGAIARLLARPLPEDTITIIRQFGLCALAGSIFCYIFDIANQTTSVLEDKLNKPYRPIPAGLLTMDQAYRRWWVSWTLGPLILYSLCGEWAAIHLIGWELFITFFYVWPKYNHWFCRNFFAGYGAVFIYRIENAVVSAAIPEWHTNISPDLAIGLWFTLTIHLQEFHDIEGDRATGRRTLPVILTPKGCERLRLATASIMIGWSSLLSWWTWTNYQSSHSSTILWTAALQQCLACITAVQTMTSKSKEVDGAIYFGNYTITSFALVIHQVQMYFHE
jgi:4-hydroxybenzoate polyprenyltransferase